MNISYTTHVLNFFLACFKQLKNLKKALFEISITLSNGEIITPDLLCFITEEDVSFYSAFEFKQRGIDSVSEEDIQERLIPQYRNIDY